MCSPSRSILLALLTVAMGGSFMIEQPGSSLMRYYGRLQWLTQQCPALWLNYHHGVVMKLYLLMCMCVRVPISQVYRTAWWMAHYGARTAKRHQGFSNNKWVEVYNRGKLLRTQFRADPKYKTAKYRVDEFGVKRWTGTKALKQTQLGP